jgi:uncharacterized protein
MNQNDRYIAGVPCWVDTTQGDPKAAGDFYGKLFGWEVADVSPPDAPASYYIGRLRGGDVAGIAAGGDGADAVWNTYIWVDDADATVAKVREAGGTVLTEPTDVGDTGRFAVVADPAGAAFCVWQPAQHRGATVVNEHGALNFNDLNTRDLDGAQAFYGAVFGWDLLSFGADGGMWALAAYGDFLEQRDPGLRERMADIGAPERFEDVVASVRLMPDVEPHWGVTFAVDDADAIAAQATELGGRVEVPPFDAPWVRMTVISDPQGATFTASKFVPENSDIA